MHKKDEVKILNWIIPEMGKGSGGHLNIFRFVSFLENMGFHNRIYLFNAPSLHDNESVSKFLKKYFPIFLIGNIGLSSCWIKARPTEWNSTPCLSQWERCLSAAKTERGNGGVTPSQSPSVTALPEGEPRGCTDSKQRYPWENGYRCDRRKRRSLRCAAYHDWRISPLITAWGQPRPEPCRRRCPRT